MKKLIFSTILFSSFAFSALAQNPMSFTSKPVQAEQMVEQVPMKLGKMTFNEQNNTYDYGVLPEGPKATHIFHFVNTGDASITITNAQASCGCTSPEYPKETILPGKKGTISVTYSTEGHPGNFEKSVHLTFTSGEGSTAQTHDLTIKGVVKAAVKKEADIVK